MRFAHTPLVTLIVLLGLYEVTSFCPTRFCSFSPSPRLSSWRATELADDNTDAEPEVPINGISGSDDSSMSPVDAAAEQPSDVEPSMDSEEDPLSTTPDQATDSNDLQFLETLGAITGRGEFATAVQKESASKVVARLEESTPVTISPEQLYGTWELVFSTTQLFRSSPFFMAGRAVCTTEDQAKQYNWFCDMHRQALAISRIGSVRQVIGPGRIVSEFETKVGAVPFLNDFTPFSYSGGAPVEIEGAIVSSADWELKDGKTMEFLMDTVEIKGSNIPGLRQVLDSGLKLQSRSLGSFLETNLDSYSNPRPTFATTFFLGNIRVSRDQDDNIFVYCKVNDSTEPTDYSNKEADLGIGRLLEGFNNAIGNFSQ